MSIIRSVLRESAAYYADVEKKIKRLIKGFPQGSAKRRKIGNSVYWYLQKRVGSRVAHVYLGKKKPIGLIKKIAERKRLLKELKKVGMSKKLVAKAIKGKNVRSK